MRARPFGIFAVVTMLAGCADSPGGNVSSLDPGSAPWEPVQPEHVAEQCGLDPELLARADAQLGHPWAAVRYGKLCHEFYPDGVPEDRAEVFSATKTMGALVTGIAVRETS